MSEQTTDNPIRDAIAEAIATNRVILFMKGTPDQPMCGFSARTSAALQALDAPFAAVDILPDPRIRQELSALSNWPTIPQLFVGRRARRRRRHRRRDVRERRARRGPRRRRAGRRRPPRRPRAPTRRPRRSASRTAWELMLASLPPGPGGGPLVSVGLAVPAAAAAGALARGSTATRSPSSSRRSRPGSCSSTPRTSRRSSRATRGSCMPARATRSSSRSSGHDSVLLLDEDRHLRQRKLMLPPFHGERMKRHVETMAEAARDGDRSLAAGRAVRAAPAHAGRHPRGDHARGLRRDAMPPAPSGCATGMKHFLELRRRPARVHADRRCSARERTQRARWFREAMDPVDQADLRADRAPTRRARPRRPRRRALDAASRPATRTARR